MAGRLVEEVELPESGRDRGRGGWRLRVDAHQNRGAKNPDVAVAVSLGLPNGLPLGRRAFQRSAAAAVSQPLADLLAASRKRFE